MDSEQAADYSIVGPEVDLDSVAILDSKGRRVDQEYVDRALAEVEEDLSQRGELPD